MRDIKIGPIEIYTENTAGKLTICTKNLAFHLFPEDSSWGIEKMWIDGPVTFIGFGPFLLISYYP